MNNCLVQAVFYHDPDTYPPVVNSARLLAEADFKVGLLCRDVGETWNVSYPDAVRVKRLKSQLESAWLEYLVFVIRVLRNGNKDAAVFVGHDMRGLLPAWLLAKRYGRPLVYHCHDLVAGSSQLPLGSRLVRAFERRFARTADLVIVPDAERAKIVKNELNLDTMPLVVANAPIYSPDPSSDRLSRTLRNRDIELERIVFRQGSLGPGHAIEATIRSLPFWGDAGWGFVVMGKGAPDYLNSLRALAKELDVSDRFVVLSPVSYDEVAEFTVGAQVGHALYEPSSVNHRTATTSSNKIMEYMASGLPIIVPDWPALRSLVREYKCGVTADQTSPKSIARAVNMLLSDPDRAQRMGNAGRRAFIEKFNCRDQFMPVIDRIRELCR